MGKLNLSDLVENSPRSMLAHLLIETIASMNVSDFRFIKDDDKNTWADVKLTVNGIECELKAFADNLESQLDKMIDAAASEKIEETQNNIKNQFDNLFADLKTKMGLRECRCHEWED